MVTFAATACAPSGAAPASAEPSAAVQATLSVQPTLSIQPTAEPTIATAPSAAPEPAARIPEYPLTVSTAAFPLVPSLALRAAPINDDAIAFVRSSIERYLDMLDHFRATGATNRNALSLSGRFRDAVFSGMKASQDVERKFAIGSLRVDRYLVKPWGTRALAEATVTILDKATGAMYLVQELLKGKDLRHHLDQKPHRRIDAKETSQLLVPILEALEAAHQLGVLHRDVKPANIFLDRHGAVITPKLIDFGLSKLMRPNAPGFNTGGGVPALALNSGGVATYVGGSGTKALQFRYTVRAGENSAKLDYTSTSALASRSTKSPRPCGG